ncbi:hypothetical protein NW761_014372 [Fusarium oxysporum]|nr:hypothetical protein NW753_007464 [Fusarium oxysporum]KAJ4073203.1 hypothetical protein NW761_014372 [Fusarium oxysporum]KAJ4073725.1 hypothetical protein NW756_014052 [Fusarium oxysporum]KAJ4080613.1 hypothetical protein NW769_014965 [Fusarium oxysporum]
MAITSLLPPSLRRPLSNYAQSANLGSQKSYGGFFSMYEYHMLRNNFRISTWILAGACAQSLLVCLAPHAWSLAPAAVLLGWRLADTLLIVLGVSKNRYLDNNIPGKWAVHFPDSTTGEFSEEPADADVCVIILAARSNHPLGMFAPNYKTLFEFGNKNVADLEANAPENGYLGCLVGCRPVTGLPA